MTDGSPRTREPAPGSFMGLIDDVISAGMTHAELANAVGSGPRAVQNWASGHGAPRGAAVQRLLDIHALVKLLGESYTVAGINTWLHARNRNLDMRRPIELIVDSEVEKVIAEAEWVAGGMGAGK